VAAVQAAALASLAHDTRPPAPTQWYPAQAYVAPPPTPHQALPPPPHQALPPTPHQAPSPKHTPHPHPQEEVLEKAVLVEPEEEPEAQAAMCGPHATLRRHWAGINNGVLQPSRESSMSPTSRELSEGLNALL